MNARGGMSRGPNVTGDPLPVFVVDAFARRFQIQEDLVRDVAREMMESGHARGVRVRSRARHLCMCSRGPSSPSSMTHTEYALGTLAES